jgi:hypothetical protein
MSGYSFVIAGLDPAIHRLEWISFRWMRGSTLAALGGSPAHDEDEGVGMNLSLACANG